jgi:sialate O-acetylesterase
VIVEFDYADGGLRIGQKDMLAPPQLQESGAAPNVELAGRDKRWHKAEAKMDGTRLVVRSPAVPEPVGVRYCYENIPQPPFLYNAAGLPAAMFTTLE